MTCRGREWSLRNDPKGDASRRRDRSQDPAVVGGEGVDVD